MVKEAYCLSDRFCPLSLVGGAGAPSARSCAGVELGDRFASNCTLVLGLGVFGCRPAYSCQKARIERGTRVCLNLNKTINLLMTK